MSRKSVISDQKLIQEFSSVLALISLILDTLWIMFGDSLHSIQADKPEGEGVSSSPAGENRSVPNAAIELLGRMHRSPEKLLRNSVYIRQNMELLMTEVNTGWIIHTMYYSHKWWNSTVLFFSFTNFHSIKPNVFTKLRMNLTFRDKGLLGADALLYKLRLEFDLLTVIPLLPLQPDASKE